MVVIRWRTWSKTLLLLLRRWLLFLSSQSLNRSFILNHCLFSVIIPCSIYVEGLVVHPELSCEFRFIRLLLESWLRELLQMAFTSTSIIIAPFWTPTSIFLLLRNHERILSLGELMANPISNCSNFSEHLFFFMMRLVPELMFLCRILPHIGALNFLGNLKVPVPCLIQLFLQSVDLILQNTNFLLISSISILLEYHRIIIAF